MMLYLYCADTLRPNILFKNVDGYEVVLDELKAAVVLELQIIQSIIMDPMKELQTIMKTVGKMITKREHKVCVPLSLGLPISLTSVVLIAMSAATNILTKLRDKIRMSLNDAKTYVLRC